MVRVHRLGQLGDWLWQYAFARALAERFAYELAALPLLQFPSTRDRVRGTEILGPAALWEAHWPRDAYSGRSLERAELVTPPAARVTLRGGFQRFDLISSVRDKVREHWFRLDSPPKPRSSGDFLICLPLAGCRGVGVRRAAYQLDRAAEQEVRRLAKNVPHRRLFFLTDRPRHPIFAALRDLRGEVQLKDETTSLRFIHSFQRVAICQSSLQWWATFLGSAREIYFPLLNRGLWAHPEPPQAAWQPAHFGIDVRVDDSRYIYDWQSPGLRA